MSQVSKASKNVYLKILCTSFLSFLKVKKDSFFISYKNYSVLFFVFIFISFIVFFLLVSEVAAQVVINELSPASSPEWVELYNTSDSEVSLDGFVIYFQSTIDTSQKKVFCSNYKIAPRSFVLIETSGYLNNDGDTIILKQIDDTVDSISYGPGQILPKLTSSQSGKRDPDGSSNWMVSNTPSKNGELLSFSCPTPTSTLTPTPVSTSSSNSSSSKSTVKINSAKDQNGSELLGSLKIYIDGNYTGNYAPETYRFCSDCKCGSNNVPCGFGNHTFKVEKTGYNSWTRTAEINADNNYEFDPVLILASPTLSPTLKTTPTATASATPKSTTFNISTSNESALLAEDVFSNKGVLGTSSESKTPTPVPSRSDSKFKLAALFFIISGLSFLGSAVYAYLRKKKNAKPDEAKSEEAG